jgi:ABC-type uncharacterized transport system fused permease/ATPase subunit
VRLYQLVLARLAKTTVFSIGHRATLRSFHARLLMVQPSGRGPASIVEVAPDDGLGHGALRHDKGTADPR